MQVRVHGLVFKSVCDPWPSLRAFTLTSYAAVMFHSKQIQSPFGLSLYITVRLTLQLTTKAPIWMCLSAKQDNIGPSICEEKGSRENYLLRAWAAGNVVYSPSSNCQILLLIRFIYGLESFQASSSCCTATNVLY